MVNHYSVRSPKCLYRNTYCKWFQVHYTLTKNILLNVTFLATIWPLWGLCASSLRCFSCLQMLTCFPLNSWTISTIIHQSTKCILSHDRNVLSLRAKHEWDNLSCWCVPFPEFDLKTLVLFLFASPVIIHCHRNLCNMCTVTPDSRVK